MRGVLCYDAGFWGYLFASCLVWVYVKVVFLGWNGVKLWRNII